MTIQKNQAQARLDRLIADGGSPTAIKNLQKQLGVTGGSSSSTTTPATVSNMTPEQTAFEQGYQGYIDSSKQVYDMETSRSIANYDLQKKQLETQAARNREDYARYTSQAQTQTNRQLAANNSSFSRKLSSAANAYGQRGLLRSGIAKQQTGEATREYSNDQVYYKTQAQKALEAQQQSYDRAYSDNADTQSTLGVQRANYESDRSVGKIILDKTLQYAGDSMYNSLQLDKYQNDQAILASQAKARVNGRVVAPTRKTWRSNGVYSQ